MAASFPVPPSVLVVEDDADVAVSLEELLLSTGFTVHVMRDGRSALEWLAGNAVDLIISDFKMEPVDGVEFLRKARHLSDAPAILYTAYPDLEVALEAVNLAHVSHLLRKPGDPERLLQAAQDLASRSVAAKQRDAAFRRAMKSPWPTPRP